MESSKAGADTDDAYTGYGVGYIPTANNGTPSAYGGDNYLAVAGASTGAYGGDAYDSGAYEVMGQGQPAVGSAYGTTPWLFVAQRGII